jgi:ribosomal protein S18 acetylase RimI-like enzyme
VFKIIRYSEAYQEQYCDLYIKTWEVEPYGEALTHQETINSLEINKGFLYLLVEEKNDKVIGFIGGRSLSKCGAFFDNAALPKVEIEKGFYIGDLGVDDAHKRSGWGQVLMSFLISTAKEKGFSEFVLRTHAADSNPAIGLYNKLGMTRRRTEAGEVHGIETTQSRIDGRPEKDFRIYFYKTF